MLKNKSIDYIFGMITGASLMLAFWACTTPLDASGSNVQEVRVVNDSWEAVYVRSADQHLKTAQAADWNIKPIPKDMYSINCNLQFTDKQLDMIKRGVRPEEMEEKWFIYYDNSNLYIYRSWTGICVFIVKFSSKIASEIMVNPDKDFNLPLKEEIPKYVDRLINNLLLS